MSQWRVMLDTDIVCSIMRFPASTPGDRLAEYAPDQLAISAVVLAELRFGAVRVSSTRLHNQIAFILQTVAVLEFSASAASDYAQIRTYLEQAGTPISPNDLPHCRPCSIAGRHPRDRQHPRVLPRAKSAGRELA